MRISIFGLGYVGSVSAACFAKAGHTVVGCDVDPNKLGPISEGRSPIVEANLDEFLSEAVKAGRLSVTNDANKAVAETDISLICVGTPSRDNGDLKTDYVERVSQQLGQAIKQKGSYHIVIVRSTVLPGTTHSVVIPALEEGSGGKCGVDFGIAMNPEFLREGSAIADFYDPPFTVIGCENESDGKKAQEIYSHLDAQVILTDIPTAEMIKYGCNAFHAVKTTFANEMGIICKMEGIDSHKVMDILCKDLKLNISPKYLIPGFAFGGSCLPKDVRALTYRARHNDIYLPMLEAVMPSNKLQIDRVTETLRRMGKRNIGLLGLSFKAGTDDLRESPLVVLAESLIGKGYNLRIFDPNVSYAALYGSNKTYIEAEIPHIASILGQDADAVLEASDILIFSHSAKEFKALIPKVKETHTVIDLARVCTPADIKGEYIGLYW
ncbi:MAG: UDP-glucose/GDP-mannose dehydrogenase family protein [bacterium]